MKIKYGLIKMTLGQLIFLTLQVKILTKCNYYPQKHFYLTRFNGTITTLLLVPSHFQTFLRP